MKRKRNVPLSLRLSPELNARLEECAKNAKQKKHTLAQAAVEAAVEAIEKSGGYLVVPIEFEVLRVPAEKSGSKISSSSQEAPQPQPIETPAKKREIR